MNKKVILALGCLALLASVGSVARADVITFSFVFSPHKVDINTTGLTVEKGLTIAVSDGDSMKVFPLIPGTASLSTGPSSSYSNTGGKIMATYLPGGTIQVDSLFCVGGKMPGVCLAGVENGNGTYAATTGKNGSFKGLFTVTYVSPYITTTLFHQPDAWEPGGSDAITTGQNKTLSRAAATATLGGGSITFNTVPEPGTLALMGTGFMGLAGVLRRKINL